MFFLYISRKRATLIFTIRNFYVRTTEDRCATKKSARRRDQKMSRRALEGGSCVWGLASK